MGVIKIAPLRKKSGLAPTFGAAADAHAPVRKFSIEHSIGPLAPSSFPCKGRDPGALDHGPARLP
jgi:hypothetical protein